MLPHNSLKFEDKKVIARSVSETVLGLIGVDDRVVDRRIH